MSESTSLWRRWGGPWRSWTGLVAVGLIIGQGLWRGVLLDRGFFTEDDFLLLRQAAEPLSIEMLTQDYAGHFFPGLYFVAWAHAHAAPLEWGPAVIEILLMQALAAALLWIVLSRILPGSWARIPLLAVGLTCPLALWPTQWWASSLQFLPISICLLLATWALLVHLQEAKRWALPSVLAATFVGLLFQERAVLFPVILGVVACAWSPVAGPRAIIDSLRSLMLRLWAPIAALLIGYVLLHRAMVSSEAGEAGSTKDGVTFFYNFVARNVVPASVGGPWNPTVISGTLLEPSVSAVVLAWVVVVAALVWSVTRTRSAIWGWLLLGGYTVIDASLILAGRASFGGIFGLLPRYASDIVPVIPLSIALVVRAVLAEHESADVRPERHRLSQRSRALVACGLALSYVGSSAVTTAAVASYSYNRADRRYVETFRAELRARPDVVIFDASPPDDVMSFWFDDEASVSAVVGIAPEAPVFDTPSHDMRMVDLRGRLVPFDLVVPVADEPTNDGACVHPVNEAGATVALKESIVGDKMVARIVYYTSARGTMTVTAARVEQTFTLRQDVNVVDIVVEGSVDSLEMKLNQDDTQDQPGTVCVVAVQVGFPVPLTGSR